MISEYRHRAFDTLPVFRDAKLALAERRSDITKIGDVLCLHGLNSFIGVNLLHKHFNLTPSEVLVRQYHEDRALMRPKAKTDGCVPYIYRVEPNGPRFHLTPLEFIDAGVVSDNVKAVAEVLDWSQDFVNDLGAVLTDLDLIGTFGIFIINNDVLPLREGEIMMETTDWENRILTLKPTKLSEVNAAELTETTWSFNIIKDTYCPNCRSTIKAISERKQQKIDEWKRQKRAIVIAPGRRPGPGGEAEQPRPEDVCVSCCIDHCHNHCHSHCQSHCISHGDGDDGEARTPTGG